MSVELFFLFNLLADFSMLAAAARGLNCLRIGRVALASALSAIYGTLARCLPALAMAPVQFILLIPLSMLLTCRTSPREVFACALSLGISAVVTGTCAAYCRHVTLSLVIVPAVCALTVRTRRCSLTALMTPIEVVHRGRRSVLQACIDTGNRLIEPLSGQPVMIADANLLRDILPETGYREVGYGSVGGGGTLKCFRADCVYIHTPGKKRRAPDTWIALFPERLPGAVQALAPAVYILE